MLNEYADILTLKECREILFIGYNSMLDLIKKGKLKAFKVGRNWRVKKSDLLEMIEN